MTGEHGIGIRAAWVDTDDNDAKSQLQSEETGSSTPQQRRTTWLVAGSTPAGRSSLYVS